MEMELENVVASIPVSLRNILSKKLVTIILSTKEKDIVPVELAKRIIFLWQKDQLDSEAGIRTLLEAAFIVDAEATSQLFVEFGLQKPSIALRS